MGNLTDSDSVSSKKNLMLSILDFFEIKKYIYTDTQDYAELNINFSLYPNPTSGDVYLTLTEEFIKDIDIYIYDISGKLLLNKQVKYLAPVLLLGEKSGSGNSLNPGVYIVKVRSGSKLTSKKLIIR